MRRKIRTEVPHTSRGKSEGQFVKITKSKFGTRKQFTTDTQLQVHTENKASMEAVVRISVESNQMLTPMLSSQKPCKKLFDQSRLLSCRRSHRFLLGTSRQWQWSWCSARTSKRAMKNAVILRLYHLNSVSKYTRDQRNS